LAGWHLKQYRRIATRYKTDQGFKGMINFAATAKGFDRVFRITRARPLFELGRTPSTTKTGKNANG
jgi:hypothetical protein